VAFRLRQELIVIICPTITITIGTPTPTDNQRARAVNGQPPQKLAARPLMPIAAAAARSAMIEVDWCGESMSAMPRR
jgi:hypothetical protein